MSIFEITIQEARGAVAVAADIDQLAVVIGVSSLGSGLSTFFLSGSSAIAALGQGDAVDTLTQVIEQRQEGPAAAKKPAAMYSVPSGTNGSYGAVDVSGITGAASAAASGQPRGTYEARLRFVTGGVVGTDGMKLRSSLDDGRTWSAAKALGTATSYTIPNSGVTLDLTPTGVDLTALNTLLNEEKADHNAHIALTAGGVHGAADATNVITEVDATDSATRVALANALRAANEAHRILTAGGVHGAADATNVITVPVATDDSSALALALAIKAARNAHIALIAGGVHGAADGTNDTTSVDPAAGTFNAGDEIAVATLGPVPGSTELAEAFTALAASTIDFTLVVLDFPCDAALAAFVTTGLNELQNTGREVTAIVRTRLPDFEASETEAAWAQALESDFANFEDSRICVRAGYGLVTDAVTTRQYRRSTLQQFAADIVRVERYDWPAAPADRAEPNVSLIDGNGVTVGHDEGPRGTAPGLSNATLGNRFSCEQRLPDAEVRESVYNTVPWVMYAADEKFRNLMTRRLANAMKRVARSAGRPGLGRRAFYRTVAGVSKLTPGSRASIQGDIFQALRAEFRGEIDNADDAALDSGLVQVDPVVAVSGGNLLGVSLTLSPVIAGFVLTIAMTLSVQE
jgi:hypothetical protein